MRFVMDEVYGATYTVDTVPTLFNIWIPIEVLFYIKLFQMFVDCDFKCDDGRA